MWVFLADKYHNAVGDKTWEKTKDWALEADKSKVVVSKEYGLVTEKGMYHIVKPWCTKMTEEEYKELLESQKTKKGKKRAKK